jgi:hypothetical protein
MVDKLMDMCERHADDLADMWYKSLMNNSRTEACRSIPKEVCLRYANQIYSSIADMYFAEDCYKAVAQVFDISGIVDIFYARGIPLEQALYSLILMKRHIWLYADSQMLFNPSAADMTLALDSINRILLVFDYATYYITQTYQKMAAKAAHHHNPEKK